MSEYDKIANFLNEVTAGKILTINGTEYEVSAVYHKKRWIESEVSIKVKGKNSPPKKMKLGIDSSGKIYLYRSSLGKERGMKLAKLMIANVDCLGLH